MGGGSDPKVYGADLWGNHVSSFKHSGAVVHRWGTNHPAVGGFNEPSGLAVGTQMYVADTVNQRMERFTTATGVFNQAWGARGWEKSDLTGFNWPRDVTLNTATNTVWVADTKNNRLTQFTTNGTPTGSVFGHLGSDSGSLHWPFGIASVGTDVVVADTFNNRVERIDGTGLTVEWNNDALHNPRDVTVAGGVVYVADSNGNSVVELTPRPGTSSPASAGCTTRRASRLPPTATSGWRTRPRTVWSSSRPAAPSCRRLVPPAGPPAPPTGRSTTRPTSRSGTAACTSQTSTTTGSRRSR